MKKTFVIIIFAALMSGCIPGCISSKVASHISVNIGEAWLASRDLGVPELKKLIKAWPYISGQIQAIPNYDTEAPMVVQQAVDELDVIAAKNEELTDAECGKVSTLFIVVEYHGVKYAWDKWGVSVTKWAKLALGIGG